MEYLTKRLKEKARKYLRRKNRVNTIIKGQYPEVRVVINKSNKYIFAQAIDQKGNVVAVISDKKTSGNTKSERAKSAGLDMGNQLKEKKVEKVVFDRNGYLYHGRVAAFADGLREAGVLA